MLIDDECTMKNATGYIMNVLCETFTDSVIFCLPSLKSTGTWRCYMSLCHVFFFFVCSDFLGAPSKLNTVQCLQSTNVSAIALTDFYVNPKTIQRKMSLKTLSTS